MERILDCFNILSHPIGPTIKVLQTNDKAYINCFDKPFTIPKTLVHLTSELIRNVLLLISPASMVFSDFNEVKLIGIVAPLLAYYIIGLANLKVIDKTATDLDRRIKQVGQIEGIWDDAE